MSSLKTSSCTSVTSMQQICPVHHNSLQQYKPWFRLLCDKVTQNKNCLLFLYAAASFGIQFTLVSAVTQSKKWKLIGVVNSKCVHNPTIKSPIHTAHGKKIPQHVTLSKALKWKLIEVVYSICKFQICRSSNNEKSHLYSPMVKSPIAHSQGFDVTNE